MSNLRTILEELVFVKLEASDDLDNKLCNDFISQAEQKIKELMLGEGEMLDIFPDYLHTVKLAMDNQPNIPNMQVIFKNEIPLIVATIHSAILKKTGRSNMTTQEQLEKIIVKNSISVMDAHPDSRMMFADNLATTILSAMRIDEKKLHYLLEERNPLGMRLWEQGADSISLKIASHAQEIITFKEE